MKSLKKSFRELLLGTNFEQEYICSAEEKIDQPFEFSVGFLNDSKEYVIENYLFIGYKPLLIGIVAKEGTEFHTRLEKHDRIAISYKIQKASASVPQQKSYGKLWLVKISIYQADGTSVFIYEGKKGRQKFHPPIQWFFTKRVYHLKASRVENVYLPGNLYEQIMLAYSYPRKIALITVFENNRINIFPTDLHGEIGKDYYVVSLRKEGKACEQVIQMRKMVLMDVDAAFFKNVYAMGKNHMKEMTNFSNFELMERKSLLWGFPLSAFSIRYRELELCDTQEAGIHRLLFFKCKNREELINTGLTLCHFKNVYATWREKKGLSNYYLLR